MSRSILLVQLADIGDMILTTPAIAALRGAYPAAHLVLLTTPHAAKVVNAALVDEVLTLEKSVFTPKGIWKPNNLRKVIKLLRHLRRSQLESVVFFHHFTLMLGTFKFALIANGADIPRRVGLDNGRGYFLTDSIPDEGFGAKHQAQYWLDLVGLLGADSSPRPAYVETRTVDLPISKPREGVQRVIIHAGSGGYSLARRWEPEHFAQVADRLLDRYENVEVVLVGTVDDDGAVVKAQMRNKAIDLIGKTTLPELAGILQKSDLFIGADSGVMHLAAAVGTPTIAIFGPSNDEAWGPWQPDGKIIVIRNDVSCSPCSYVGHGIGLREGCAARTCMKLVTVSQVLDAAKTMLHDVRIRKKPRRLATEITDSVKPIRVNRIEILGLPVDKITYAEWMQLSDRWVKTGSRLHHVCTTNPEFMMIAKRDPNFYNILHRADLCIPDGVGLLWAAKQRGNPLPERVTGSDGVPIIAEHAAKLGWKLFFLGAGEGIAAQAAKILRERYTGLQIVGVYSGNPSPDEEDSIVERVNQSEADILLVAYGAPEQDKWIARNNTRLNVKMAMGVGGSFDFIAGVVPRAPQWMRNAGLEWLFRLYKQPWRLKRMLRLPRFVLAVLFER